MVLILWFTWLQFVQADSCRPTYTLGNRTVHLPCVDWLPSDLLASTSLNSRQIYQVDLQLESAENWSFQWQTKTLQEGANGDRGATYNPVTNNLYIPVIDIQTAPGVTVPYQVILHKNEVDLLIVKMANPILIDNQAPIAASLSQTINSQSPTYYPIQLAGSDVDGDTLEYELLVPDNGNGYTQAYLDPDSHILYVMVVKDFSGNIELPYRVTDGKMFSNPATVTLYVVGAETNQSNGLGSKRMSGRTLAGLPRRGIAKLSKDELKLPTQVDLSDRFPIPLDQGAQNSCVGWTVGYALKTYQEAVEMNWPLRDNMGNNIAAHLFSPSFIYNQVITKTELGYDRTDSGIRINDALQLVVEEGIATLEDMPYNNILEPIPDNAKQNALNFKAKSWGILQTTDEIKQSLSVGLPVVTSMAVYKSFQGLKSPAAIYNTAEGEYLGDHAVTIVGYDDDFAGGGAFKVINSWGTDWGENGYFWLPYNFLNTPVEINGKLEGSLLAGLFVLLDDNNPDWLKTTFDMVLPTNSPNLAIMNWKARYDPKPFGNGVLEYSIANIGSQIAAQTTINVSLILSKQANVTVNNYYNDEYYPVVQEDLDITTVSPTENIGRSFDFDNGLPFQFPSFPPGTYYLHLIINRLDAVDAPLTEKNQADNISPSADPIIFASDLPDLTVDYFYVEWDKETGEGQLDYTIVNKGNNAVPANINWPIKLVLKYDYEESCHYTNAVVHSHCCSGNQSTSSCSEPIILWERQIFEELAPSVTNQAHESPFSEEALLFFNKISAENLYSGYYQVFFTVDFDRTVEQSFYGNDISYGASIFMYSDNDPISAIPNYAPFILAPYPEMPTFIDPVENQSRVVRQKQSNADVNIIRAYNGKSLLSKLSTNRKVRIRNIAEKVSSPPKFDKETHARNQVIWPTDNIIYLPPVTEKTTP